MLGRISTRIINEVDGLSRVTYDVSSKHPAIIVGSSGLSGVREQLRSQMGVSQEELCYRAGAMPLSVHERPEE